MKCSVIIPTYNRMKYLKCALENLFQQDFPDYEIIVVDDGSSDGTSGYLEQLKKTKNLSVIHQTNRGPAAARNAGIHAAKGEIIALTDDDCVVPRDWIRKLIKVFEKQDIGFAGGIAINKINGNFYSTMSQEITNHVVRFCGSGGKSTSFLTSNNIAYRSVVLQKANCFDTCFRRPGGEERTLNHRILNLNIRGVLVPDLVIEHYHKMSLRGFFRQQRNYGRGSFILFHIIGPKLRFKPSPVSPVAHLGLIKSWLKANPFIGMIKIIFYVFILSQNFAGYLLESFAWSGKKY
jgi:glycosyltransferase involved in cell wall biosynthesis